MAKLDDIDPRSFSKYLLYGAGIFFLIILLFSSTFIVDPGHRGVLVTMGKVAPTFAPEGLGFKSPFVTTVVPLSVRQQTYSMKADCYSSDLQQVTLVGKTRPKAMFEAA